MEGVVFDLFTVKDVSKKRKLRTKTTKQEKVGDSTNKTSILLFGFPLQEGRSNVENLVKTGFVCLRDLDDLSFIIIFLGGAMDVFFFSLACFLGYFTKD